MADFMLSIKISVSSLSSVNKKLKVTMRICNFIARSYGQSIDIDNIAKRLLRGMIILAMP